MSMREKLRASTAALHAAVDARFAPLMTGGMAGYRQFLHASAAAILPLETALSAAGVSLVISDWDKRARSRALRDDLADIGATPPDDRREIFVGDAAYQLGMLYVLEGSRLGARILVRQLQEADAGVGAATRYLRHGEGRGALAKLSGATGDLERRARGARTDAGWRGRGLRAVRRDIKRHRRPGGRRLTAGRVMIDGRPLDLTNCDREPIHLLGAIQPFGFLIAVASGTCGGRARLGERVAVAWRDGGTNPRPSAGVDLHRRGGAHAARPFAERGAERDDRACLRHRADGG